MRLINTASLEFEEFLGSNTPKYAILSHTWEDGEVSYKDYVDGTGKTKKGYHKILMTCKLALEYSIPYAWVDTCCIDKASSAELTEAINSMFAWYQGAKVCYVYLSDLEPGDVFMATLGRCRWFTRGWTLQELIAPRNLLLFDRDWNKKGSKNRLVNLLSDITGITRKVLLRGSGLHTICVAQKMSWAAQRETTRIEDMAYSLLGIFDVNMPLLYGEGNKAFQRLQGRSSGQPRTSASSRGKRQLATILAQEKSPTWPPVLADSPSYFREAGDLVALPDGSDVEYSISNLGIKISCRLALDPPQYPRGPGAILPVCVDPQRSCRLGIRLRKCGFGLFARMLNALVEVDDAWDEASLRNRHLVTSMRLTTGKPTPLPILENVILGRRGAIMQIVLPAPEWSVTDVWPWNQWDPLDRVFFSMGAPNRDCGVARIRVAGGSGAPDEEPDREYLFFGLGWGQPGSSGARQPFFTLVDAGSFASPLAELKRRLEPYDHSSQKLLEDMTHIWSPRGSSSSLSESDPAAAAALRQPSDVAFTATLVSDKRLSSKQFYWIEFGREKGTQVDDLGNGVSSRNEGDPLLRSSHQTS